MPRRCVRLATPDGAVFTDGLRAIESELQLARGFAPDVETAAEHAATRPRMPDRDATEVPLVTIDPPGSMDLDQAMHLERRGRGYRVVYAIADVSAFVTADDPVDEAAHVRGETLYAPDHRIPLYPSVLCEGAASLLPGETRPALLWTIDLDEHGEPTRADVVRAVVRSRARYDYAGVQKSLDAGSGDEVFTLLREIGRLRLLSEAGRGGVSLPLPEQEITVTDDGWRLEFRATLDVEQWNAQISLLTGMQCAEIMLYGEVGVLRTLPPPTHSAIARLRRTAGALHLDWKAEQDYPAFVRSLEPGTPAGAAMLNACATLLRGAGYVAFHGGVPEQAEHAAMAAAYAHATAPLRRLVDRYSGEIAVSLCADKPVPEWVLARLQALPKEMGESDQRAHQYEGEIVSLVEAGTLAGHVGETFTGVVTEVEPHEPGKGSVMLREPAVEARVTAPEGAALPLGETVSVRLSEADVVRRVVHFELAP